VLSGKSKENIEVKKKVITQTRFFNFFGPNRGHAAFKDIMAKIEINFNNRRVMMCR
jgi:hypothetical protein